MNQDMELSGNHRPRRVREFKEVRDKELNALEENELKDGRSPSAVQENKNTMLKKTRMI